MPGRLLFEETTAAAFLVSVTGCIFSSAGAANPEVLRAKLPHLPSPPAVATNTKIPASSRQTGPFRLFAFALAQSRRVSCGSGAVATKAKSDWAFSRTRGDQRARE